MSQPIKQFIRSGSGAFPQTSISLRDNWQLLATEPGILESPSDLKNSVQGWIPASVPGTVAQTLQNAEKWDLNQSKDFDVHDWWYQCTFDVAPDTLSVLYLLHFTGLATLAEVWLNGEHILQSDNMFHEHQVDVSRILQTSNVLTICFRALTAALSKRRARPGWKTKLVHHQQLRWIRTTLLGRIPGWSPPIAPVGPWRDIILENRGAYSINEISLRPYLENNNGIVDFSCKFESQNDATAIRATLSLDSHEINLQVEKEDSCYRLFGQLQLPQPELWWPHTHGKPALYPCKLLIQAGEELVTLECGDIGFRKITVNQQHGGFTLSVNGTPIFCRGACWTVNDIVSINGTQTELEHCLNLARTAGMNMLRVGGTMVYESEEFYAMCDKLGILVWQDFMFANMDYPIDDEHFETSVTTEITQQLKRWQSHPSIAVYCGNSEIEQQAAMLGMPAEEWRNRLFSQVIPQLCHNLHPDIPYVPSTPSGGTMPFHVGTGVTHYYGVGAYMRPISEVRRANVRFTPECLGYSNVPEEKTINSMFSGQQAVCHHPLWKTRVPRDTGTGWDFEDVRDHYLKTLFQIEPVELRCFDMPRYLALSRITTGEVMSQVFSEWRSAYSQCGGALVWFFKDLWPGAGWGIIDSTSTAKAAFRYLHRSWQPQTIVLTDEGLDGVHLHVINEKSEGLCCRVELLLLRAGRVVVARAEKTLEIFPRTTMTLTSDELLEGFYDVAYVYRFGPPKHDVVIAILTDSEGHNIAEAFHFPGLRTSDIQRNVELSAKAVELDNGDYMLNLETDTFLQAVHFDINGFYASDEYFHLLPGKCKQILLKRNAEPIKRFRGYIESISLEEAVSISLST